MAGIVVGPRWRRQPQGGMPAMQPCMAVGAAGLRRHRATLKSMPHRADVDAGLNVEGPAGPRLADWNLLRSFVAVFETGTLTAAAQRLGTTQPSMGRHLRELETALGETLFVRLPGRLRPTARAQALYDASAPMQQAVRDAERLFVEGSQRIVGVVRVAVAEAYIPQLVPSLLAPLLSEQPDLEIELSVSNRADNLLRRDADMAVRFFRPQQDDLIVRKLGHTEMGLFAHQSYIDRFGEPQGLPLPPEAFVAGFDREPMPLAPAWRGGPLTTPLRFRLRSDSALARQAAVDSGFGLGMYFVDIAATRPDLKRVLADRVSLQQEVWLCAHDDLRRSSRMRFVWDRLGDALEARLGAAPAAPAAA
jgi:DNA-binding transcriptional LysR family regulator